VSRPDGPTAETAIIAWFAGVVVGSIAAYLGVRFAHRLLIDLVVDQFDLALPPLASFQGPWTWVSCSAVAAVILAITAVIVYDEFDTKLGVIAALPLAGLLALPVSFVGIGIAESVGWVAWHFAGIGFALSAWLALTALSVLAIGAALSAFMEYR
jgi:hypothetical protein